MPDTLPYYLPTAGALIFSDKWEREGEVEGERDRESGEKAKPPLSGP